MSTDTLQTGEVLIEQLGLSPLGREGHDVKLACIDCDSSDAMRVHCETGVGFCHSCKAKWSPYKLALAVLGDVGQVKAVLVDLGIFEPRDDNGAASNPVDLIERLAKVKSCSAKSLRAYGATIASRNGRQIVRFPVYDETGEAKWHFDVLPGDPGKLGKGKLGEGHKHGLFIADGRLPQPSDTVSLCEGVKDAAKLHEMGRMAIGLPTSSLAAQFARLFRGVHVFIIADRDKAGEVGAQKTAAMLYGVAASVYVVTLPGEYKVKGGPDVRDVMKMKNGEKMLRKAIEDAVLWEPPAEEESGEPTSDKPEIYAGMADLEKTTKLAWEALIAANDPPVLFRHGSVPSRIERDDDDHPVAKSITQDRMKFHLAASAKWYRLVGKELEKKACSPPKDVVANVMATPDMPLPILTRIVEAPIFAADGTLQTKPGYHAKSKTYYEPAKGFSVPAVPDRPTQQQIADARELLLDDLLGDFPFIEAAEWAHSLAVLLHPFCRELIDGPTPLHLIEKPTPGTGATLLVDMLAHPSLGHNLAGMTEGRDEDEWRKRITAKLRGAEAFFLIDNLGARLQSPALASAITTPRWEDRVLGVSEMASISVRCCWVATGNNPVVSSEIARRTVRIRLDAKVDRPWMREGFRHPNLRTWAKENRSRLVWAALTLIRAWLVAGRPAGKAKPIGMFESWSAVVGGILDVAEVDGFLGNLIDFYDTADEEGKLWRAFVTDWWNTWGDRDVMIKELVGVVKEGATFDLGDKSEQSQRIRLGKKVGSHRDRVYEIEVGDEPNTHPLKVRVQHAGEKKRAILWKLGKLG